jgi:hypothetical protein
MRKSGQGKSVLSARIYNSLIVFFFSGDLTQRAVNGPAQSMSTLSTPYIGVPRTGSISSSGVQNHAMPVSMNPGAMDGVRSSPIFTQSPSVSQIQRPTGEDLIASKRWTEEKKRMAFSSS